MLYDYNSLRPLAINDILDGDVILEVAKLDSVFGRTVYRYGWYDAERKGVPVIQHTKMKTTKNGVPHQLEAIWRITESPLVLNGPHIILRPRKATPTQIAQAIAYGRSRLGRPYGVSNVIRIGLRLAKDQPIFWLAAHIPFVQKFANSASDRDDMFCAQFNAEQYDRAGYPPRPHARDKDYELAPWDWMGTEVLEQFYIVGRFG